MGTTNTILTASHDVYYSTDNVKALLSGGVFDGILHEEQVSVAHVLGAHIPRSVVLSDINFYDLDESIQNEILTLGFTCQKIVDDTANTISIH